MFNLAYSVQKMDTNRTVCSNLRNPVGGERYSVLKANTHSGGKAHTFCRPAEWRWPWNGMFSTDEPQGGNCAGQLPGIETPTRRRTECLGWMVAQQESAELAKRLIQDTCGKQNIVPGQLTIHADRGSSMTSKPVAFLLAHLGITKTHSRPHVSDDNPFSESQFRTFKYRPDFPDRFGSIQHSREFGQQFFLWYNQQHRHSSLGLLTPAVVHYGQAPHVRAQ